MAEFEFELEKGSKKFECPNCGTPKKFKRYVRRTTGEYMPLEFGRCDRENSCRYHVYPSKEYFSNTSERKTGLKLSKVRRKIKANYGFADKTLSQATQTPRTAFDVIPFEYLKATLGNYENNDFVQFLIDLFPDCIEEIQEVIKQYFIGTAKLGKTVFWQVDQKKKIRTGKIIAYDTTTGKRRKDVKPNWIHSELKRLGRLEKDFNLMQCYFGQHLLLENSGKLIALVEAEKSAIVGSLCFPGWLWLAIGSKQNLTVERLQRLGTRPVILFPDADGYNDWQQIATQAKRQGLDVRVSDWVETEATDAEKVEGSDVADFLIQQQRGRNENNKYVDSYNSKLEHVLNDESLLADFNSILDEQKAILVYNGLSEIEAEMQITQLENFRSIILSL
jgi:hypothetical protein